MGRRDLNRKILAYPPVRLSTELATSLIENILATNLNGKCLGLNVLKGRWRGAFATRDRKLESPLEQAIIKKKIAVLRLPYGSL